MPGSLGKRARGVVVSAGRSGASPKLFGLWESEVCWGNAEEQHLLSVSFIFLKKQPDLFAVPHF